MYKVLDVTGEEISVDADGLETLGAYVVLYKRSFGLFRNRVALFLHPRSVTLNK